MADLPAPPDHTVISVGFFTHLEDAFADAIKAGTRAATIFADTRDQDQQSRITSMAREAGIPLIGPNSMGCHNFDLKMITPFPVPLDLRPGGLPPSFSQDRCLAHSLIMIAVSVSTR